MELWRFCGDFVALLKFPFCLSSVFKIRLFHYKDHISTGDEIVDIVATEVDCTKVAMCFEMGRVIASKIVKISKNRWYFLYERKLCKSNFFDLIATI
jgi:hypothetical protein